MARKKGSRTRGIVLLVLVGGMTLLLAHGLYATLAGPRPASTQARATDATPDAAAAALAGLHADSPAPAPSAGTAVAAEEEPAGPPVYRGAM